MPENIDSLLADLGVDPNAGTPDTDQDTQTQNPVTPETNSEGDDDNQNLTDDDGNTDNVDTDDAQTQIEQQKMNQAFAAMRAENSKYKKVMQNLMRGSNFAGDENAFIKLLEDEAYKKQAQIQGMAANPELLRKMDEQEERIQELTRSQRDQTLMLGLKTLQQTHNLTGKEVETFVQRAIENKIDLLAPGVDFDTLYKGIFFDDIVKKKIESERQEWIKQSNKSNDAANPDGKSGKKETPVTDVKTMAEFNSLLDNVSKIIK